MNKANPLHSKSSHDNTQRVLVDVRSPQEHAEGSVPHAVNLPLLSNDERAAVGTTYKKDGRFAATEVGLSIFAAKAAGFLRTAESFQAPLEIYCARGGLRSEFTAKFLAAAGLDVTVLEGGYKAYRNLALRSLHDLATKPLLVLDGLTGAGKTDFLHELEGLRQKTLDFESCAFHRGSAFGDFGLHQDATTTQQNFENGIALKYEALKHNDVERPIFVELENAIGPVRLPHFLRKSVYSSPMIIVKRSFQDRVTRLATLYAATWDEEKQELFANRCLLLQRYLTRGDLQTVIDATKNGDFHHAVALLLEKHYDRVYAKGLAKRRSKVIAELDLTQDYHGAVAKAVAIATAHR